VVTLVMGMHQLRARISAERIAAEVHLAEPAETSGWKGKKKRGNTDWADARHCESCC
jgi:hypothetical protein